MPQQSKTGHVTKRCACAEWKTCPHPFHVSYQEGSKYGKKALRVLRGPIADIVGREPIDYADAKVEAQRAILAWKDGRDARGLLPGDVPTLATLLEAYRRRKGDDGQTRETYQVGAIGKTIVLGRRFGEWRAPEITREALEAFRLQRPVVAGNRDLALLRAAFNWAVLTGLVPSTPFKVGTVSAVKLSREESRTRRLQAGEEERLLDPDNALGLRDLIIAALETGCRRGELLSLQWWQVRETIELPAGKTKAKKPRRVPITDSLRAVLDRRRIDPAGDVLPSDAYVFGDDIGRRRGSIKTAWKLTCKRAKIDGLHFHDLRREAGSRWMDAGVPLAMIQRWLGHHNISQTSTYLAATGGGDVEAMRGYELAIGRVRQRAANEGSSGDQPTPTDTATAEKTPESATIH